MKLSRFDPKSAAEKGATLHLRNPLDNKLLFEDPIEEGGEPRPVTIDMKGVDAPSVQKCRKDIERRRVEGEEISDEEASLELTVAAMTGWSAISVGEDVADTPFSKEKAKELLSDPEAAWVFEQTGPFTLRRSNFLRNAPKG